MTEKQQFKMRVYVFEIANNKIYFDPCTTPEPIEVEGIILDSSVVFDDSYVDHMKYVVYAQNRLVTLTKIDGKYYDMNVLSEYCQIDL